VSDATEAQRGREHPQNIATAITEVSERATLLIHEEIELAKAEISEKVSKLLKGAVVAGAAGIFVLTALIFLLNGFAWLLYYALPIGGTFTYFWGFFAMALILLVLGALAGVIAARAVRKSSPPVPTMAIAEARKIRESVGSGSGTGAAADGAGARTAAAGARPAGAARGDRPGGPS